MLRENDWMLKVCMFWCTTLGVHVECLGVCVELVTVDEEEREKEKRAAF